jgi:hypothetical protein
VWIGTEKRPTSESSIAVEKPTHRELAHYATAMDAGQNSASRTKTLLAPGLYVIRDVSNPPRKTEEGWARSRGFNSLSPSRLWRPLR